MFKLLVVPGAASHKHGNACVPFPMCANAVLDPVLAQAALDERLLTIHPFFSYTCFIHLYCAFLKLCVLVYFCPCLAYSRALACLEQLLTAEMYSAGHCHARCMGMFTQLYQPNKGSF